ncbi:DUF1772 domain-containing protein [Actinocrispum wychmicini]|uniref:Putative membrane protein n=1 Tax=Actinocrispum wychmicini TaxID=1213861 RepID=A0A4R2J4T1_9PSEU|nr:DUF1772 domain-containing protein [Actinocrispum wychmicini]TCO52837.1 putative membrane protein [Actinocrispum wychmicini]
MLAEQGANLDARPKNNKAAAPLLWLSVLTSGLMAGFFWSFTVMVMPALAMSDDRSFVTVFQNTNRTVESFGFGLGFYGALLFSAIAAWIFHRIGRKLTSRWLLVALACVVIQLVITMAGNIPLNNALDSFGDPAKITDFAAARHAFNESQWNLLNLFRTIISSLGVLAAAGAAVQHGRDQRALLGR